VAGAATCLCIASASSAVAFNLGAVYLAWRTSSWNGSSWKVYREAIGLRVCRLNIP